MKNIVQTSVPLEKELDTNPTQGLSDTEAQRRLRIFGYNKLPEERGRSLVVVFLSQFASPLIAVLAAAAAILFFMGEHSDAGIIGFILFFNAALGSLQEGRASRTLAALKNFIQGKATVIRDGNEMVISDTFLVPGDILLLQEGEKIPADARLIKGVSVRTDESLLTGESGPVEKNETMSGANTLFKGTTIVHGNGTALVTQTGLATEVGKISASLSKTPSEIPLKREIRLLSTTILLIVGVFSLALFSLGLLLGKGLHEMFGVVVSLAVSIIPEGLPIVITIVLASGAWRMAKHNALIKKLQAVEALGQADVIAVDKTGTLTRNELVVRKIFVDNDWIEVTGDGTTPEGSLSIHGREIVPREHHPLTLLNTIAALSANAHTVFSKEKERWHIIGDPTEGAMIVLSMKMGVHKEALEQSFPRISEIAFDYKTKYHATLHEDGKREFLTVAGAPEAILHLSTLTPAQRNMLQEEINRTAHEGFRVICFAYAHLSHRANAALEAIHVQNLTFAGFYCMQDSLRPEAPNAVQRAQQAGLSVVMITGDHASTATSLARDAGIMKNDDIALTADEFRALSQEERLLLLSRVKVFARVTPEDKMMIIQAYKDAHSVIAMTGDGVNDAPALLHADLGIAMGRGGTDVAREAADIVLLDDNFATIVTALEEGRNMVVSVKRVLFYLFATSIGEALTITGALLAGLPLPLFAAQIIWLNMITDSFLDVSLGMEPKGSNLLARDGKGRRLIDHFLKKRIVLIGICMMAGSLGLFMATLHLGLPKAMTMTLTTLAVAQWLNALNARSEHASIFSLSPFSNRYLLGAFCIVILLQLAALYTQPLQSILRTVPLSLVEWGMCLLAALPVLCIEEFRKYFTRTTFKTENRELRTVN